MAVIELRRRFGKSRPPFALHAGDPGGSSVQMLVDEPDLDHWLRTEVVSALIRGAGPTCVLVWLTRAGLPRWHDQDAAWVSPVLMAWGETRSAARFVVVTPRGWYAPLTGQRRQWRRPREHS